MLEETINGRADEITASGAIGNGIVVAAEGAYVFGVGGMLGSVGTVGKRGNLFRKEWIYKQILGQEFSQPIKHPLDRLRKEIW